MKIGIDARYAFRPVRRGIGRSLLLLLEALTSRGSGHEFILYTEPSCEPGVLGRFCQRAGVRVAPLPSANPILWEQLLVLWASERDAVDLFHATSNVGPVLKKSPMVLTLFDVIDLQRAKVLGPRGRVDSLRTRLGASYRNMVLPAVLNRADRIITASEASKRSIVESLLVDPAMIDVIPLAPDPLFLQPAPQDCDEILQQLGIRQPYIFTLTALDPRKNLPAVLEAFNIIVRRRSQAELRLVIAGSEDPARLRLQDHPAWPNICKRVSLLPFVPDRVLHCLYTRAVAFVYASFLEGFGLPALEAMGSGTLVICAAASSLPEIVNGYGLLFDALKPEELAEKILWALENPDEVHPLVQNGRRRAGCHSWGAIAESTLSVYEGVLGGRRA